MKKNNPTQPNYLPETDEELEVVNDFTGQTLADTDIDSSNNIGYDGKNELKEGITGLDDGQAIEHTLRDAHDNHHDQQIDADTDGSVAGMQGHWGVDEGTD